MDAVGDTNPDIVLGLGSDLAEQRIVGAELFQFCLEFVIQLIRPQMGNPD